MAWDEPLPITKASVPEDAMRSFVKNQIEAVGILREEKDDEQTARRIDACNLAMRYLDSFQAGQQHTTLKVIEAARVFERYLLEP